MLLYKYRSLTNFEYVLDIILNQRLHCSTYPELNDPFEGLFVMTTTITIADFIKNKIAFPILGKLPPIKFERTKEVKDFLGGAIDKVKICSLSSNFNDVRLWSYYADSHRGIVFEIEFSGLEERNGSKLIHPVTYSEKLHQDRGSLLGPSIPEVLSHKTYHWGFESEYRVIEERKDLEEGKYFSIKDRIKAIYLGTRTSDKHLGLLKKLVQGKIPIWTTKINKGKIIVEPDKLIER